MYSDNIIEFKVNERKKVVRRKEGINKNRNGSVRKINGKVYVDFTYLGERVRESSGLHWSLDNEKRVRKLLDKIMIQIESNEFVFSDTFPDSNKKGFFTKLELNKLQRNLKPSDVLFKDYVWEWYNLRKISENNAGRTLMDYKGYINKYLLPFFGNYPFGSFNKVVFDNFTAWAKEQKYRGKPVSNESIKKYFVVLKMICKDAKIKYEWVGSYDPFFGFKMPKSNIQAYEKILPFSIDEQIILVKVFPHHWKHYFEFAFASGVSQGEQIGIYPNDIDWRKKTLKIRRAITLDESGKIIEGPCKNKFRRRTIHLSPRMIEALQEQKKIYEKFNGKYFFCNEKGGLIDKSNFRKNVWIPALEKVGLDIRDMRQTRHSFGTYQLSKGTNPLKIAKVMGHRDAEMVLKVYGKYIDDGTAIED